MLPIGPSSFTTDKLLAIQAFASVDYDFNNRYPPPFPYEFVDFCFVHNREPSIPSLSSHNFQTLSIAPANKILIKSPDYTLYGCYAQLFFSSQDVVFPTHPALYLRSLSLEDSLPQHQVQRKTLSFLSSIQLHSVTF